MARPARGVDNLEWAREVLARAQTVEQLRQAQAVVLPLDYGLVDAWGGHGWSSSATLTVFRQSIVLHLYRRLVLRRKVGAGVHGRVDLPKGRVHDGQQVQA